MAAFKTQFGKTLFTAKLTAAAVAILLCAAQIQAAELDPVALLETPFRITTCGQDNCDTISSEPTEPSWAEMVGNAFTHSEDEVFTTTPFYFEPANFAAAFDQNTWTPKIISPDRLEEMSRQVWQIRIASPQTIDDTKNREQLSQMIEKIRSLKFPNDLNHPTTGEDQSSQQSSTGPKETNDIKPTIQQQPQPQSRKNPQAKKYAPSEQDLAQLDKILAQCDPNTLTDEAFALAEILFNAGRLEKAAVFYSIAIENCDSKENDFAQSRPWMLFQMGNCVRHSNPTAAIRYYQQLLDKYPTSDLAQLAQAQVDILTWYVENKPAQLINNSDTSDAE